MIRAVSSGNDERGRIFTKMDAWRFERFESGKTGRTKLIIDLNLKPLATGGDGLT
jgi:hypothetical protein